MLASKPAYARWSSWLARAAEDNLNFVRGTVIEQLDGRVFVGGEHFAVDLDCNNTAIDSERIVHGDLITCRAMLECDFKSGPASGDTRVENQVGTLDAKPEERFENYAVHPSRRSRVPRPSAAPDMRGLRIDIGASHIWLDLVSMNFARAVAVMNRIQHRQQLPSSIAVTLHCKRLCCPQGGMGVLPAILTDPGRISLDVAGILDRIVKGRRKQQRQPRVALHETLVHRRHTAVRTRSLSSTGKTRPGWSNTL